MNARLIFLPVTIIVASFIAIVLMHKTIAPVDLYLISPELYKQGNVRLINNNYVIDTATVMVPWKYYVSQYSPRDCETNVQSKLLGSLRVGGIELPGGFCYPLRGVRAYLYLHQDLFSPLSRIFKFFAAYDLSYMFEMIFMYLALVFFFICWLDFWDLRNPRNVIIAVLAASFAVTSYPVARDIQFDALSESFCFLVSSLGILLVSLRKSNPKLLLLSLAVLFVAANRSSLQAVGFCLLFWFLFAFLWGRDAIKKSKIFLLVGIVGFIAVFCFTILYQLPGIQVFLASSERFVPPSAFPLWLQILKRTGGWITSLIHFFMGDMSFAYDTMDFSKILGSMGARDNFTYDENTFFINPFVSFVCIGLVTGALLLRTKLSRKVLVTFAAAFAIDFLIIQSPLYRLMYFRFHYWWMLLFVLMFLSLLFQQTKSFEFRKNRMLTSLIGGLIILASGYFVIRGLRGFALSHLQGYGTLGFEPGFWEWRIDLWLKRISLRDYYSWVSILFVAVISFLLWKRRWNEAAIVITISGLFLNTFRVNLPQSQKPLFDEIEALKNHQRTLDGQERFLPHNLKLMANLPVPFLYESLSVPMPGDLEPNFVHPESPSSK